MWHRSLLWSCGLVVSRSVLLLSLSPLFHSSPPLSDPLSDPLLSSSERYLVEFKNKLLVEMLAVAQLDAEKNADANHNEQVKVEALKWELAKRNQLSNEVKE